MEIAKRRGNASEHSERNCLKYASGLTLAVVKQN